jgi:hypothetical protein
MTAERRVRRLRLTAAREGLVSRGALLLEDALRTASLPEPGQGRVLFIRSLALGVIRADRSPSSLALALERRVQALARDAVHAEEVGAPSASAVFFRDAVEALVSLGSRLAGQAPLDAWFWKLVLPEAWVRPRDEALRKVLAAALETELGSAGAVALLGGMEARGAVGPLLGALRWQDGPSLMRSWWQHVPETPRGVLLARAPAAEVAELPPRLRALAEAWIGTWGQEDARSLWLISVVLCLVRPARAADPALPTRAARVIAALSVPEPRPVRTASEPSGEVRAPERPPEAEGLLKAEVRTRQEPAPESRVPAPRPQPSNEVAPAPVVPAQQPVMDEVHPLASESRVPESPPGRGSEPALPRAETASEWPLAPEPSSAGGLLFLVHALTYLGLPELLEAQPELIDRAVPEHFLAWVAERLAVPATDPMLRAIRAPSLPSRREPCPFSMPARFRERSGAQGQSQWRTLGEGRTVELDGRGRIPLCADDLSLLLRALHLGVSHVLRTRARLSLRALVLRPSRVVSTPTHVDVLFDHRLADLRVRRAGLDVDPGWVPWLGRVIRYHYLHGELPGN